MGSRVWAQAGDARKSGVRRVAAHASERKQKRRARQPAANGCVFSLGGTSQLFSADTSALVGVAPFWIRLCVQMASFEKGSATTNARRWGRASAPRKRLLACGCSRLRSPSASTARGQRVARACLRVRLPPASAARAPAFSLCGPASGGRVFSLRWSL